MRYEDWAYHPSRLPEDKYEQEKAVEVLQEHFYEQALRHPQTEAFLKSYRPESRDSFLKQYAFQKRLLVAHSGFRLQNAEKRDLRYRDETESAYAAILQKKIFNAELRWRAEQITIPGIEATVDFHKWYDAPAACPFIEAATAEEIALMQRFLQTELCDTGKRGLSLRIYSSMEIIKKDEDGGHPNMPEWFEYYDTYLGSAHLLLLPDLRSAKEDVYRTLEYEERKAEHPEHYNFKPAPGADLPWMNSYSAELHYEFAKLVDDEIFRHLFHYQWQEEADKEKAEEAAGIYDAGDYIYMLENIPDPPPVRAGVSWREALYYCWMDYLRRVVGEDLPLAWEEHKFYLEMGLSRTDELKKDDITQMVRDQILRGRELAGEPRDFNF